MNLQGRKDMKNEINLRFCKERRIANHNVTFPLRNNNQAIIIAKDRRVNPDRRRDGLEVTD